MYTDEVGLLLWLLVSLGSNLGTVKDLAMEISAICFFVLLLQRLPARRKDE